MTAPSTDNSLPYLCDGIPCSGRDLIREAKLLDQDFADDWIHQTSVAARILREHGYTVEENK